MLHTPEWLVDIRDLGFDSVQVFFHALIVYTYIQTTFNRAFQIYRVVHKYIIFSVGIYLSGWCSTTTESAEILKPTESAEYLSESAAIYFLRLYPRK